MFHPRLVGNALDRLSASPLGQDCPLPLDPLPLDTCRSYTKALKAIWDPKRKQTTRGLTPDEQAFVDHERLVCAVDYRYWAERYATILRDGNRLAPLTPFWASQEFTLQRLAARELAESQKRIPDGVLVNVLKARQLGETTLSISILTWRMTSAPNRMQLIAGDVPEQSSYMFGMLERILAGLPWFLNPGTIPPTNIGDIVTLANQSATMIGAGKSMRGGLQDKGGEKSNLGRGKTISAAHLSELSTWERPEGLDSSLFVALPQHPMTFAILESTAKGRSGWWPDHWYASQEGLTRFANLFIPWYIEPKKWRREPPPGWQPTQTTIEHATRVERTSEAILGQVTRLDPDQQYWYESERAAYDRKDKLYEFFEEYPADAEEAFQHSGKSIFSPKTLDYLRNRQRPLLDCFFVQPTTLLAARQSLQLQFPNGVPNDYLERP